MRAARRSASPPGPTGLTVSPRRTRAARSRFPLRRRCTSAAASSTPRAASGPGAARSEPGRWAALLRASCRRKAAARSAAPAGATLPLPRRITFSRPLRRSPRPRTAPRVLARRRPTKVTREGAGGSRAGASRTPPPGPSRPTLSRPQRGRGHSGSLPRTTTSATASGDANRAGATQIWRAEARGASLRAGSREEDSRARPTRARRDPARRQPLPIRPPCPVRPPRPSPLWPPVHRRPRAPRSPRIRRPRSLRPRPFLAPGCQRRSAMRSGARTTRPRAPTSRTRTPRSLRSSGPRRLLALQHPRGPRCPPSRSRAAGRRSRMPLRTRSSWRRIQTLQMRPRRAATARLAAPPGGLRATTRLPLPPGRTRAACAPRVSRRRVRSPAPRRTLFRPRTVHAPHRARTALRSSRRRLATRTVRKCPGRLLTSPRAARPAPRVSPRGRTRTRSTLPTRRARLAPRRSTGRFPRAVPRRRATPVRLPWTLHSVRVLYPTRSRCRAARTSFPDGLATRPSRRGLAGRAGRAEMAVAGRRSRLLRCLLRRLAARPPPPRRCSRPGRWISRRSWPSARACRPPASGPRAPAPVPSAPVRTTGRRRDLAPGRRRCRPCAGRALCPLVLRLRLRRPLPSRLGRRLRRRAALA